MTETQIFTFDDSPPAVKNELYTELTQMYTYHKSAYIPALHDHDIDTEEKVNTIQEMEMMLPYAGREENRGELRKAMEDEFEQWRKNTAEVKPAKIIAPQIICLTGGAGTGKTRLAREVTAGNEDSVLGHSDPIEFNRCKQFSSENKLQVRVRLDEGISKYELCRPEESEILRILHEFCKTITAFQARYRTLQQFIKEWIDSRLTIADMLAFVADLFPYTTGKIILFVTFDNTDCVLQVGENNGLAYLSAIMRAISDQRFGMSKLFLSSLYIGNMATELFDCVGQNKSLRREIRLSSLGMKDYVEILQKYLCEPEEEHTEVSIPWEVQALFADLEDIPRLFTAALSFMSQPRIVGQPRVSFENQSKPYPSWPISKKAIRMFLVQSETTLGKDVDEVYYCIKDNMAALKLADVRDLRTKSTALQILGHWIAQDHLQLSTRVYPIDNADGSTLSSWQTMGLVVPKWCPEGYYTVSIPLVYARMMMTHSRIEDSFPIISWLIDRETEEFWTQAQGLDSRWVMSRLLAFRVIGRPAVLLSQLIPNVSLSSDFLIDLVVNVDCNLQKLAYPCDDMHELNRLKLSQCRDENWIRLYLNGRSGWLWDNCILGYDFCIMVQGQQDQAAEKENSSPVASGSKSGSSSPEKKDEPPSTLTKFHLLQVNNERNLIPSYKRLEPQTPSSILPSLSTSQIANADIIGFFEPMANRYQLLMHERPCRKRRKLE